MKKAGFAIVGILAVAVATYGYFDYMFNDLSKASLFEEEGLNGYF